jgi:CheY-like chemotaxis protein
MCQALSDLLNNAVKFTSVGGQIGLEVAYLDGKVRIAVTDTGIGIAPEQMQCLFQPFVQIDGSFKRQFEGTGLGLALVKGIVDLHGGEVVVTSQLGLGSTFTIDLPCEPMPPIAATLNSELLVAQTNTSDVDEPELRTPARLPLILLVDSNQASINTISSYLKAKGYQTLSTNNARSAIIRIEDCVGEQTPDQMPDLLLMDMQMSVMDGFETIGQIRKLADLPIIALSAADTPDDRERCLAAGATEYLPKPVKLKQLAEIVRQLLG